MKTSLISARRIIFTPTQDLKDELADTAIQITCYDRNGEIVKRVTSSDPGTVEDTEDNENGHTENTENTENNSGGGENTGGDNNGGDNGGGGDDEPGGDEH